MGSYRGFMEVRGHVTTDGCLRYRLSVFSYFSSEITSVFSEFLEET